MRLERPVVDLTVVLLGGGPVVVLVRTMEARSSSTLEPPIPFMDTSSSGSTVKPPAAEDVLPGNIKGVTRRPAQRVVAAQAMSIKKCHAQSDPTWSANRTCEC